jgi:hypothetical protein
MPPYVSTNLVANLREVHYKGYVTNIYEPMVRCNVLNVSTTWFKVHVKMWEFKGLVD